MFKRSQSFGETGGTIMWEKYIKTFVFVLYIWNPLDESGYVEMDFVYHLSRMKYFIR